jgi:uncharacterized protein YkwD
VEFQINACIFFARHCWIRLFIVLIALTLPGYVVAQSESPQAQETKIYIPTVFNQTPGCHLSPQEAELSAQLLGDPGQQRTTLTCNPILAAVARARATDMANRNYFDHTNPDGFGPNYLVQSAGYVLPSYYSQNQNGNNVESIAAGQQTTQDVWTGLMGSPSHRDHLLGQNTFYAEQIDYGIGYASKEGSTYVYYWVILTAKSGND